MQGTEVLRQGLSRTALEVKNKLQIKENSHLFNHIDKLALDHDVFVSDTMIKVTYKKALKDQNASENSVNSSRGTVYKKDINQPRRRKNKGEGAMNLCNNDISLISPSPKMRSEGSREITSHSTPKSQSLALDKTSRYVNGLNFSPKPSNVGVKSPSPKLQKKLSSHREAGSNIKKLKATPGKTATQQEVGKRFLKNNNSVVKQKTSIIQGNSSESKKVSLKKNANKKLTKSGNSVNKKAEVEKKGVKRKSSGAALNNLAKKRKISENKAKEVEEGGSYKGKGGKRPIMLEDPDLPTGWTRYIRTKSKGSANEQYVVYVVSPAGKQFRFKWKLRKYLEKTNSSLDVDQFFFGLYQRPKSSNASPGDRDDQSKSDISETKFGGGSENRKRDPKPEEDSSSEINKNSEGKELLLYDPDLPFGWKRVIHSNSSNGRKQVHIISPDGKIFRRRYRLNEYLKKYQYGHDLDRFYFGLYRKKDGAGSENSGRESEEKAPGTVQTHKERDILKTGDESVTVSSENENEYFEFRDESPMYDDPNLPEGWKRLIRVRSCGESAGRREVIIVSPDGRKHRSRKHLERYLLQKSLPFKAKDFDFHLFGKKRSESAQELESEQEPEQELDSEPNDFFFPIGKKKFYKPVPELDIDSLKELEITPEGRLINEVNGLMVSVGLSSARNERRQRLPRREHENQVQTFLSSTDGATALDGCEISTTWVQTLVKCRGDFRTLEPDAASTVGKAAKEFLQKLSLLAFSKSENPHNGLRYEDLADIVHRLDNLSPLQTLIPKKITYKEYIKLNRPKQFLSFT